MKLFRYTFQKQNGESYYVDSGVVMSSFSNNYLTDDPKDWKNTMVSFTRDGDFHGMLRKSGAPLLFHSDAALILRSIYYTDSVNGYCKVIIEKQNRSFTPNNVDYSLWFACEIDFTSSFDGDMELPNGDIFFTTKLVELGLSALIENHKDDTYEIPIYAYWSSNPAFRVMDPSAKQIEIGDITMDSHYEWVLPETKDSSGNDAYDIGDWLITIAQLKEDQVFEVIQQSSEIDLGAGITETYFLRVTQAHNATLELNFDGTYTNQGPNGLVGYNFRRIVLDQAGGTVSNTIIWTSTANLATNATVDFTITDSYTDDLQVGWTIRYLFSVHPSVTPPQIPAVRVRTDGFLYMDSRYVTPPSRCFGFTYKDLLQRVINKMAGSTAYTVVSDLLDSDFSDYFTRPVKNIVVPATSIRNLDDPKIKTSFTELTNDINTLLGSGWSPEGNNLRVEKGAYFYNESINLLTINTNSTVQKITANGYIYNRIKIGFNDASVDEINGLQEFCCEQEYNCGLEAPSIGSQELNLVSSYIHGTYSIENIRSYLFRSDNTSTPKDNETCVIEVNQLISGVYYPNKAGFDGTTFKTGLKYPADVYNIGHDPKACLIRQLPYVKSYLKDGSIIKLTTASKNVVLSYGNLFITIESRSNLEMTVNGAKIPGTSTLYDNIFRIFLAFIFQYKGEVPENLLALMETANGTTFNKYGVITIIDSGVELKMFALDIGVTPATDDVYQIRGLCTPSTNLLNLIR